MIHENIIGGGSGAGSFGVDVAGEERKHKYLNMHLLMTKLCNRICLDDAGGGGSGGSLQFIGLVDVNDIEAQKAARKLQKLLMNYERGTF